MALCLDDTSCIRATFQGTNLVIVPAFAEPRSTAANSVPSPTNPNALACVPDPINPGKSVLFSSEHTSRSAVDTPVVTTFSRPSGFSIAANDSQTYNMWCGYVDMVNPSSGRAMSGLVSADGGVTCNVGANTEILAWWESGVGTLPTDFASLGAIIPVASIKTPALFWESLGTRPHAVSLLPQGDHASLLLAPSQVVRYWGRLIVRQGTSGVRPGVTFPTAPVGQIQYMLATR